VGRIEGEGPGGLAAREEKKERKGSPLGKEKGLQRRKEKKNQKK